MKQIIFTLMLVIATSAAALAQQPPGTEFPPNSLLNDQKLGSVLVFPLFSSRTSSPQTEDTRIVVTNAGASFVRLHFFFVNGESAVTNLADAFFCLAANQTLSFSVLDYDPNVRGFIVVVAIGADGNPVNYNFLTGEADIKLASGHRGSLKATAIAALIDNPGVGIGGGLTQVRFNDVNYNRLPRTVATNKVKSLDEGNAPLLILVSIGGTYGGATVGVPSLGDYAGSLMLDSGGTEYGFIGSLGTPQLVQALSINYPHTTPRFTTLVTAGRTGWIKIWRSSDAGLLGAMLNYTPQSSARAYTSGHNLRMLTLTSNYSITIPITPPFCP